jgi:hypothetical protein
MLRATGSEPAGPDWRRVPGHTLSEAPNKVFRMTSRGLAGSYLYQAKQVLDAMVGLTHQKVNLLLGMFARGNILNHNYEIVDRPVALTYAADSEPGPDDPAVFAQVAFFHVIVIDLAKAYLLDMSEIGLKIVRVVDVRQRLGQEFVDRPADNATQRLVGPEPPKVRAKVCDADSSVLERRRGPRFALGKSMPHLDLLGDQLAE